MSKIGEYEETYEIQPLYIPDEQPPDETIIEPKEVPQEEPVLVPVRK